MGPGQEQAMSAFAALAAAWDLGVLSVQERRVLLILADFEHVSEGLNRKWTEFSRHQQLALIAAVRRAVSLGEQCAYLLQVDLKRLGAE